MGPVELASTLALAPEEGSAILMFCWLPIEFVNSDAHGNDHHLVHNRRSVHGQIVHAHATYDAARLQNRFPLQEAARGRRNYTVVERLPIGPPSDGLLDISRACEYLISRRAGLKLDPAKAGSSAASKTSLAYSCALAAPSRITLPVLPVPRMSPSPARQS